MTRLAIKRMQIAFSFSGHLGALAATILLLQLASCPAEASYDPEQQDGIPVFSARSVSKPLDEWGASEQAPPQAQYAQRRQADSDLDDGLEDEDEDEYKSGSSPRESVENPSYGESHKAARDGDEIEDFFDKHLGPPQEATAADESSNNLSHQQVPALDPDTDDQYEAAASSPLSSIFHSLLSHSHGDHKHKRPFLQIATSSASDSDSSGSENKNSDSSSSSSPSGSMKVSQSAQNHVEAAPITLSFTPMTTAPSQVVGQDSNGQEVAQDQQDTGPTSSGVREIYIGRRPTVMSYLQQTHGHQQAKLPSGYTTAGSNHISRGPTGRQVAYEHNQSNDEHARYPIAASYAYQREPANVASAASGPAAADDEQTVTYGLSFGGSPSDEGSNVAGADGGLSQDIQAQDDQGAASPEPNEQSHQQEQPQAYEPYNTRYSTSSTRAYNNYQGNSGAYPAGPYYRQAYIRVVPQHQQVMVQPQPSYQRYSRGGSIKYHRDPSESTNYEAMRPAALQQQQYYAGYQQVGQGRLYRTTEGGNEQANGDATEGSNHRARAQQLAERQHLLAILDKEVKANPHYRSNNAAAAASSNFERQHPTPNIDRRQHLLTLKKVKKSYRGDDLDSFNSYHSEVDPYRTFTSTSRMIDDPTSAMVAHSRQVPVQSSSDPKPIGDSSYNEVGNSAHMTNSTNGDNHQNQQAKTNLLSGPLTNFDQTGRMSPQRDDLSRNGPDSNNQESGQNVPNSRVRREDADERETDNDVDDDGVWVDDDEDDDNRQQSSDVNETSQDPQDEEEEDNGQDAANNVPIAQHRMNPPGVIGGPHGYELSPNDLMVYHG